MTTYKIRFIDSHGKKLTTTEDFNNEEDLFFSYTKKGFTVIDFEKSKKLQFSQRNLKPILNCLNKSNSLSNSLHS